MAYQAGRVGIDNNKANALNSLSQSLSKFGGVMNDKQQVDLKKQEFDLKRQEEMERKKAIEIFEGENSGEIKNEYQFATKVGDATYQKLKSDDLINKNYQAALSEGAQNGWSKDEVLKSFVDKNNSVLADKRYNENFKSSYAESGIGYEGKLGNIAAEENINNMNKAFKAENVSNIVNTFKNSDSSLDDETKQANVSNFLSSMEGRTKGNFTNTLSTAISNMTDQGLEIPQEYHKEIAKLADGDANLSSIFYRNTKQSKEKKYQNNVKLNMAIDKAVSAGDLEGVNAGLNMLKEQSTTNAEWSKIDEKQQKLNIEIGVGVDGASLYEKAFYSENKDEQDASRYELERMLRTGTEFLTGEQVSKQVETQMFGGVDWSNTNKKVFEDAKSFQTMSGSFPKGLTETFNRLSTSFNPEDLEKSMDIMEQMENNISFNGSVNTDGYANVKLYKGLSSSGYTQSEVKDIMDQKKQALTNDNVYSGLTDTTKKENKANSEKYVLDVINSNTLIFNDYDIEDFDEMNRISGGMLSSKADLAVRVAHYTGQDIEEVVKDTFTYDNFSRSFAKYNDQHIFLGAADNHTPQDNEAMLKQTEQFVANKLFTGGVDSKGVAQGQLNTTKYNIPEHFKEAFENGYADELIVIKNTEGTNSTGAFDIYIKDEGGREIPLTKKYTGEGKNARLVQSGEAPERVQMFIGVPQHVVDAKKMIEDGEVSDLTEKEVHDIFSNSLQHSLALKTATKAAEMPSHESYDKRSGAEMYSGGAQYKKSDKTFSYSTSKAMNKRRKSIDKKSKSETNKIIGDKKAVEQSNKNIQKIISKNPDAKETIQNASYTLKSLISNLDNDGLLTEQDLVDMTNNGLSVIVEKAKKFGSLPQLTKKAETEMLVNEGRIVDSKHKKTNDEYVANHSDISVTEYNSLMNGINRSTGANIKLDARTQDKMFMMVDELKETGMSNGIKLEGFDSPHAKGDFNIPMASTGANSNPYVGSELEATIESLTEVEGHNAIYDEIAERGASMEGYSVDSPEWKTFEKFIENDVTSDIHTAMLMNRLSRVEGAEQSIINYIKTDGEIKKGENKKMYNMTYENEIGSNSTRLHTPGNGNSGVTLGAGYDMKHRTEDEIISDLVSVGVSKEKAVSISKAAGLSGDNAVDFSKDNSNFKITKGQQRALFDKVSGTYEKRAKSDYDNFKIKGKPAFEDLPDTVKELLFDYSYNVGASKFPKFFTALVNGDKGKALEQYLRYADGVQLGRRNDDTLTMLENYDFEDLTKI